ncbi:MAG: serine/threonine-protein kinase [Acidobacteria bacterium]|nr:serine/threonine-protein kinase [Acidobacteriota bacterium]
MLFRGQTLGKYKILAPLGSGGFGAVYLARDTWIDKDVAIKVPHRQNLNFGELLQEPRLLAALDHPNIVSITTAEKQDNIFFIVMEYVAGHTLEEVITTSAGLDAERTVHYAMQIGRAIEHAHAQGVIHRDLRPANMLVSDAGVLKVADFGTSRFLEIAAHGTTVIGSPPYMAPEQFEGKAVFASDIYSLGITMYQMLTAALPYESPAPTDLDKLRSGELVRPPRLSNPEVPKALNDVVMRALAPGLSTRYQRATDLLSDLEHASAPVPRPKPDRSTDPTRETARARIHVTPRRLRTENPSSGRFCLRCHKPLHARADRCPFCGESW